MHSWYKRSELGTRIAMFFTSATVAGAFSKCQDYLAPYACVEVMITGGLLAAAISNMDGIGGKPGWAWIFILEGLFTVLCAVASFWILEDFPENAKFLSAKERTCVTYPFLGVILM